MSRKYNYMDAVTLQTRKGEAFKVSACDEDWVKEYNWWIVTDWRIKDLVYVKRYQNVDLAREVLRHKYGSISLNDRVENLNGDPLDFTRDNLRKISKRKHNQRRKTSKTSRFLGVSRTSDGKKFSAHIRGDGRQLYLGSFDTEDEAALAWNSAALDLFDLDTYYNPVDGWLMPEGAEYYPGVKR